MPAEAKSTKVSFATTFVPPAKPTETRMLLSTRNKALERTVGIDIFVDTELQPQILAKKLLPLVPTDYNLVMLSNRGTQVWPTGSLFTECVNHYRCRIELKDTNQKATESDLLALASKIAKDVRICSLETLMMSGDSKLYTLAQGQ